MYDPEKFSAAIRAMIRVHSLEMEKLPPRPCSICGITRVLRPYGVNNSWICFPCGMKNQPQTRYWMGRLFGFSLSSEN